MRSHISQHLSETAEIVQKLDPEILENMVDLLADLRERGGRLFFLGVGGSAANASHAVNDFRKIDPWEIGRRFNTRVWNFVNFELRLDRRKVPIEV